MPKIKSSSVKVKIADTEKVRRKLIKKDLLRRDLKILKNKDFVFIPIKEDEIEININGSELVKKRFEEIEKTPKSYKEIVKAPKKVIKDLPASYDIIGDIALIKVDKEIENYKFEIGKAIIKANKNINTVAKVKPVSGELRTRDIEIISGEKKTKTIHKEFGLEFFVDIKEVYFSPRLANERKRIADLVKKDEIVLDMFCGVATFPILINKISKPRLIYGIDKNKKAIEFAKKNIQINGMYNKIIVTNKDANLVKEVLPKEITINRIIMNLPFSSKDFLKNAFSLIKDECFIHFYEILSKEKISIRVEELKEICKKNGIIAKKIKVNKIKSYTPREFYICFDIRAKRNNTPM